MMHKNYIYILHFYYNFRLQLINDAIIEVDYNMDDKNMVTVAADIEEVHNIILALMQRIHTALVKRECEGVRYIIPAKLNNDSRTPWTKKQQGSGSTNVCKMHR